MYIIVLLSLLVLSCERLVKFINGPPVNQGFMRTFGTDFYDYGWGVDETFDGGVIICGSKEYRSDRTKDAVIIKTDEDGFREWEKNYGGAGNEEFYSVKQCMDGGFILAGYSTSYGAASEVYVVKTDPYGIQEWENVYGGPNLDRAYEIIETMNGNFVLVGFTNSPGISNGNHDFWLQRIDNQGNTIWRKGIGALNHEMGYDVEELDDGSLFVVGSKDYYDEAGKDIYLVKTDSLGNMIWEKTFGSSGVYDEIAYSIHPAYPSGYLICAATNSRGNGWFDPQVIKIDYEGNIQWSAIYNGSSYGYNRWSSTPTFDGGAIIIGSTYHASEGGYEDIYLIKIDQQGQELWNVNFEGGDSDWGWAVKETGINDLILVGSTKSYGNGLYDIYVIKTDEYGQYDLDN
jgi:hypothetical protein